MPLTMDPYQSQQSQRMTQPPNVLTTKDVAYIKDAMSWELLAAKKCAHWAGIAKEQDIINQLDKAGKMHERHYQLLLSHLNSNKTM